MKRGSSVLQPPSDAAKRHTHPALTKTHSGDEALSMRECDARAAGSSPFPAATSLFSPDVSTKMASDLLIRLSEATQKAQVHPGSQEEAEQQDEPGVALSPDGPGASPEPPSLTHTPEGNAVTDTLASDLLRKLAERQDVSGHMLRLKEEEEPLEVDAMTPSQLVVKETTHSTLRMTNHHLFNVKPENQFLTRSNPAEQLLPGANMVDQYSFGLNAGDGFSSSDPADCFLNASNAFQFQVKLEDCSAPETAVEDLLHPRAKTDDLRPLLPGPSLLRSRDFLIALPWIKWVLKAAVISSDDAAEPPCAPGRAEKTVPAFICRRRGRKTDRFQRQTGMKVTHRVHQASGRMSVSRHGSCPPPRPLPWRPGML